MHAVQDVRPGGRRYILIVDDDEAIREALCAMLEDEGYSVHDRVGDAPAR